MDIALGANDRVHLGGHNRPFGGLHTRFWVTLDKDGNELFGLSSAPIAGQTGDTCLFQMTQLLIGDYDCVATKAGGTSPATKADRVLVKSATTPDVVDRSFDAGSAHRIAFNNPNADGAIEGIAVQPDDKIIVVGALKEWNGQPRTNLVRLNVDGSRFSGSGPSAWYANPDGTLVLGGAFGAVDASGFAQFNLTKLNSDGSTAPGFHSPLDQPDLVNHVARLPDGQFPPPHRGVMS